jgi:hypothetical protein
VRRTDHSSRGVLPSMMCTNDICKPPKKEAAYARVGLLRHRKRKRNGRGGTLLLIRKPGTKYGMCATGVSNKVITRLCSARRLKFK